MINKSCLIIIDVQKGIFKLKQTVYDQAVFINNLKKILLSAQKHNIKTIYTQHENASFLLRGSEDWEIIDELKSVNRDDLIINKKHPSIFKNTCLLDLLNQNKIETLYICGLISNGCIKDTCLDGLKNGFNIVLISDAHSTFYKNAEKIIADINKYLDSQGVKLKKTIELWK